MSEDLDALWETAKPVPKPAEDLDALWANAKPMEPAARGADPSLGAAATGAIHFARHLTGGLGDKLTAAMQAISDVHSDKTGKVGFNDAYKRDLDFMDKTMEASDKEHPAARWIGNGLGVTGSAAALAATGVGGGAARGWQAVSQGAKVGAGLGALGGFGAGRSEGVGGAIGDSVTGAAAGAATGGLLSGAGALAGNAVRGLVKPTAAAQLLRNKGVDLTLGQMNPGGAMSKLEEAGQHSILGGHSIADAQGAARESFQNAALNEARPIPGALHPGDANAKLAGVYSDFKPAYEHAGEASVLAGAAGKGGLVAISKAFNQAAEDPSVYATEAEVAAAKRFLGNQVSLVERAMENGGPLKARALIEMRSNIRNAIREATARQDNTAAHLLGNAEKSLTGSLEQQLPPDALASLRAADSKYGAYKTLERAVRSGGDQPQGFTPAQFSQAVRSSTDSGSYARGGGPLRELAAAGREVLDPRQPSTGAKLLTAPLGLSHAAGPLSYLANRPAVKAALLGETAWQRALQDGKGAAASAAIRSVPLGNAATQGASEDDRLRALIQSLRARSTTP